MPCGIWISHIFPSQESPLFGKSATQYKGLMQSSPRQPLSSTPLRPLACFRSRVTHFEMRLFKVFKSNLTLILHAWICKSTHKQPQGASVPECHIRTANVPPKVPFSLWDVMLHAIWHQCVYRTLYSVSIGPYIMSCCTPYDISVCIELCTLYQ